VVRPAFVGVGFFFARPVWHSRQVVVVNRTVNVQRNGVVRPNVTVQRNVVVRDWHGAPGGQHQPFVHSGALRPDGNRQGQQRPDGRQGQQRSDARQFQQRPQPVAQQGQAWHLRGDAPRANTAMPAAPRFSESRPQQPRLAANAMPQMRGGASRGGGWGGWSGGQHGGGGGQHGGGQRGGRG
jgi:uncharacterized membrane protein YgcG